ncbi:helix-turn-helix transcriptional regulator [Epilithonimonas sp.]|uniref:helix-turn-helix domain-containing protein n=1 Tax=Epilithonimonas sp. TaxID=2894511 RepID=UPI00289CC88A|nr:helix-turn-helix transcriptional regulator [Epilithonimonas sp.]
MSIGTRLKQLRKQKNFSPSQVAQKLDISEVVYNRLENDEAKPEIDLLQKLSNLYDIDLFDLFKTESANISFYNSKIEATNLINQNSVINQQIPEKIFEVYENRISDLMSQIDYLKK